MQSAPRPGSEVMLVVHLEAFPRLDRAVIYLADMRDTNSAQVDSRSISFIFIKMLKAIPSTFPLSRCSITSGILLTVKSGDTCLGSLMSCKCLQVCSTQLADAHQCVPFEFTKSWPMPQNGLFGIPMSYLTHRDTRFHIYKHF